MGDTELVDVEETWKPQIIDTVVYQDAQDDPIDEVQQGGGNVLSITRATSARMDVIVVGGEVGKDGDDDDDDLKNKKDSKPKDNPHE